MAAKTKNEFIFRHSFLKCFKLALRTVAVAATATVLDERCELEIIGIKNNWSHAIAWLSRDTGVLSVGRVFISLIIVLFNMLSC